MQVTLHTGYDLPLLVLSIATAVFASFVALELGSRARGASTGTRWAWVAGASLALGFGIWSMHFVGMLAFQPGIPVGYDLRLTLLSLLIAVAATGAGFSWVGRPGARTRDVLLSGPLVGLGIAAMHYTGMAAMEGLGSTTYVVPTVVASVLIAVMAATASLFLAFRQSGVGQRLLAACVMGAAVAGMHYTGMAAGCYAAPVGETAAPGLPPNLLALYVAGVTFAVLFAGMVASSVEQARVQRDLHASETQFRALSDNIPQLAWMARPNGSTFWYNRRWYDYTGSTLEVMRGWGWQRVHDPALLPGITERFRASIGLGTTWEDTFPLRGADGSWRWFLSRAEPIRGTDGEIGLWFGTNTDVTAIQEAEAELAASRDAAEAARAAADTARAAAEEANRAKSQFLANMSHELRTPLSAIIGYSEMLLEELTDGVAAGELASDMAKIERNARHLLGLINDVLDLSKVESGKMEVYAEDFEVAVMLSDVATAVQPLIDKKRNRFVLDVPAESLGTAKQDVTKVRQVLLNLIGNAAKFTESGVVTLRVSRVAGPDDASWLMFAVTDTGIGMTEQQLARLFERFQQADASTTRRYGGTGLGLSLTKAFSRMLGGDIAVESVPGRGSTFTVRLPATYVEQSADAVETGQPPAAPRRTDREPISVEDRFSRDEIDLAK